MKKIFYFLAISLFVSCESSQNEKIQEEKIIESEDMILFVGSYTDTEGHVDGQSDGIYSLKFDTLNGKLTHHNLSIKTTNPSYIHVDALNKRIYAVNEKVGENEAVSSFSYNQDSISFLNEHTSLGGAPCHITLENNHIFIANYVGGNHVVFSLNDDGSFEQSRHSYQYEGQGPTSRQEAPHAHMITQNPHTKEMLGVDLGTDIITFFKFDEIAHTLIKVSETKLAPGSGPRHVDFHPEKDIVYVINELNGSIDVLHKIDGTYVSMQNIVSTKNENRSAAGCAAIHVHSSGKFLYATNRGKINSISSYLIDDEGKLEMTDEISTKGDGPRDFTIDPTGKFVLVGHQNSDNIVVFKIDMENGKLTNTGNSISVPTPVCLKFEM